MKKPKNFPPAAHHRAWTADDDTTLRSLLEKGTDGETISRVLGRTRSSIITRRSTLAKNGGLPRMKRSPNGTTTPFSLRAFFHQNQQTLSWSEPVQTPVAVAPARPIPQQVQESYIGKLVYGVKRLRRGDVSAIASALKISKSSVSQILLGKQKSVPVVNMLFEMTQDRPTLYQQLSELISTNRG